MPGAQVIKAVAALWRRLPTLAGGFYGFCLALCWYVLLADGPALEMDGPWYFLYLKSLVVDGDLNFVYNPFSIGVALLWAPLYLVAHLWTSVRAAWGSPLLASGYSWPYVWAACISTGLLVTIGLELLRSTLRRWVSARDATWTVTALLMGSPLFYYTAYEPSMSHGPSFAAVAGFLWLVVRLTEDREPPCRSELGTALLLGLGFGVMTLVRWQNALYGIWLLPWLIEGLRGAALRGLRRLVPLVGAAGAVLLLQFWTWSRIYGAWFLLPQGSGFLRWSEPRLAEVLLSPQKGLFAWSPVLAVGLLGLVVLAVRVLRGSAEGLTPTERWLLPGGLVAVVLQTYLNATVVDWWGGAAFGARRFDNALPVLAVGLAALLGWLNGRQRDSGPEGGLAARFPLGRRGTVAGTLLGNAVILAVLWNVFLIQQFVVRAVPPETGFVVRNVLRNHLLLLREVPTWFGQTAWQASAALRYGLRMREFSPLVWTMPPQQRFHADLGIGEWGPYLAGGWGNEEQNAVLRTSVQWAGRQASLVFPEVTQPRHLTVRCAPFAPLAGKLRLTAVLNGYTLGEVELDPAFKEYQFALPEGLTRRQANVLHLRHSASLRYGEAYPGSSVIGGTGVHSPLPLMVISSSLPRGYLANIIVNGKNYSPERLGYNLVVLEPQRGEVLYAEHYDVFGSQAAQDRLTRRLNSLPEGLIACLALKDEGLYVTARSPDIRHLLELGGQMVGWERARPWNLGIEHLLLFEIAPGGGDLRSVRRLAPFASPEQHNKVLQQLGRYNPNAELRLTLERRATVELGDELQAALARLGVAAYPYFPAAIGVVGAPQGSALQAPIPSDETYLVVGVHPDQRELAAQYDWVLVE